MHLTKHTFIVAAATLVAAWNLSLNAAPIPNEFKQNGFAIGCQAYSFNRFSVMEAIEKTAEAGGKVIEFFPGQRLTNPRPARTSRISTKSCPFPPSTSLTLPTTAASPSASGSMRRLASR